MESFGTREMRATFAVICFVIISFGHGTTALACSCIGHPPCGPHRYQDADFVGEIISSEIVHSGQMIGSYRVEMPRSNLLQVRVVESFRGSQKVGDIVNLLTGLGGGDCGYRFKIGAKYLIDAGVKDSVFFTGICTLTAPVENAVVELRALRNIAAGQKVPDLTGILLKHPGLPEEPGYAPFPGIRVSLQPVTGGPSIESITDSYGAFTFTTLDSGSYRITIGLPRNLAPAFADFGKLDNDELPLLFIEKSNGGSTACHVTIGVESSGSISGIIKAPGNKPIDGWVNADTVNASDEPQDTVLSTEPSACGSFRLSHLPPGRYSVHFTSRAGFIKSDFIIVDLKDGKEKTGLILTAQ